MNPSTTLLHWVVSARRYLWRNGRDMPFDPRAAAEELRTRRVARNEHLYAEAPESYFCGLWDDIHPLNVPGPFYGAATDTCCDGPPLAPDSLLYDHTGQGFVWRQPRTADETHALMSGASSDPFSGYAWDGDHHWTPRLVRAWWSRRLDQQPAVDLIVKHVAGPRPELPTEYADLLFRCLPVGGYSVEARAQMSSLVARYVSYRVDEMERDLRRYVFFLEVGVYPLSDAALPHL